MVTDQQVRLLRQKLMEGKTMAAASAAAGMSERSGRTWKKGSLPSQKKRPRSWRTRPDPFVDVWDSDIVPILQMDEYGRFNATTLMDLLQDKYPGQFQPGQLRTLQRRVHEWRALYGPEKEVFFEQVPVAGHEGALDFTCCNELGVTIDGQAYPHLLFEFVLLYSAWTWVCVALSESFEALVGGLQGALWALGGCPHQLRTDNLSAATHQLQGGGRTLTRRFGAVLQHYGLASRRINRGKSHENGAVEQRHYRTKVMVEEELILRGSRDFETVSDYEAFVQAIVGRRQNGKEAVQTRLAEERLVLGSLPPAPVPSYTVFHPAVKKWSTIRVQGNTYSVPSRLIRHSVEVRVHASELEVLYRGKLIQRMPRLRGDGRASIDYRHVIWSLVRKPGAFAHYRFREELFPSLAFRRAYDALRSARGERADIEYVRILHLAASTMESQVEEALLGILEAGLPLDYAAVKQRVQPACPVVPHIEVQAPDLGVYDRLLREVAA